MDAELERQGDLSFELLDAEQLRTYTDEIAELAYDAGDGEQSAPRSLGELQARKLEEEYLKPGQHGKVAVLKSGDTIVALALMRASESSRHVTIERILLTNNNRQKQVFEELFFHIRETFPKGTFPGITVELEPEKMGRKDMVEALAATRLNDAHITLKNKEAPESEQAANDNPPPEIEKLAA